MFEDDVRRQNDARLTFSEGVLSGLPPLLSTSAPHLQIYPGHAIGSLRERINEAIKLGNIETLRGILNISTSSSMMPFLVNKNHVENLGRSPVDRRTMLHAS